MSNIIRIGVENPDELLNAGAYGAGAIIRLQWSATQTGTYADVSGTGSTPTLPLVAGTRSYIGYDPAGASTTWYQTRYENAGGTRLSDWSAPFLVGAGGLTTLDAVKADLNKPVSDTASDELLLDSIDEVTNYIHGYCGRSFLPDSTTSYTFDGYDAVEGQRCLPVTRGILTLTTLEVAGATGGTFSTLDAGTYFLRPTAQERDPGWPATELWLSDTSGQLYFWPGFANVRLTGTFGFAAVPLRIEGVARRTVVQAFIMRQARQMDVMGATDEGIQPLLHQYLSKRDRDLLDSFKIYPV